jgi:hypothetical protein
MHGAVFREKGSSTTLSCVSSGISDLICAAHTCDVIIMMFSGDTRGTILSTVVRIMDFSPQIESNCFGLVFLLSGQNRVPLPPAIITQ